MFSQLLMRGVHPSEGDEKIMFNQYVTLIRLLVLCGKTMIILYMFLIKLHYLSMCMCMYISLYMCVCDVPRGQYDE